jgi:hypothetical protein
MYDQRLSCDGNSTLFIIYSFGYACTEIQFLLYRMV